MNHDEVWRTIDAERLSMADLFDDLSEAEWQTPSLCAGWRVRDVAAHLTLAHTGLLAGTVALVRARGGPNRMIRDSAVRQARLPVERYPVALRGMVGSRRTAPFLTPFEPLVDVLVRRGLRHVILLEGINDLRDAAVPATATQIIAGYRQIIDRVHAKGAKIYGATLTPLEGSARYSADMERQRRDINRFIRTGGAFDGVIDFDRATQDPADPLRLRPGFDSGDHLHPNDAGYQAMADATDLGLFTGTDR